MEDVEGAEAGDSSRKRIPAACEACRATKIRCQPSEQPGVCRKCLSSKRECVLRSGPRVRRARRTKPAMESAAAAGMAPTPAPVPATFKTFSIEFDMPGRADTDDNFDLLREAHETVFDGIFPEEAGQDPFRPSDASLNSMRSPISSSDNSHPIHDMQGKPSFNLASAESLLASFRQMLNHFPCLVLPPGATVPELAASRPFVLLSILAASSGARTLQGHSLYDDEFRKVLGLKFVAAGDRSLQLLQGILVYFAWYPFHLRPKNKQAFQYIRMAADIVHELELDQESSFGKYSPEVPVTSAQLEGVRAFLSFYYSRSAFAIAWQKKADVTSEFTPWTSTCCDILERNAQVQGDLILAYLVRLSSVANEAVTAIHEGGGQTVQQGRLVLLGLESQLRDIQARIPAHVACEPMVKLQSMFVGIYLQDGGLLKLPRLPPHLIKGRGPLAPIATKLAASVETLKAMLNYLLELNHSTIVNFAAPDWTRFILVVVLAVRLSFDTPECPDFNHSWAREQIQLPQFMDRMCQQGTDLTPASNKVNVISAIRVVLGVVNEKYRHRLAALKSKEAMETRKLGIGCPMIDGSLTQECQDWESQWSTDLTTSTMQMGSGVVGSLGQLEDGNGQPVFHDLWTTMTMGWTTGDGGAMFQP